MADKPITSIADYLQCVKDIADLYKDEIIVYRGEDATHDKPCRPNIFRKSLLNKSDFYEKNLFDSMRQHKLSSCNSYLENAIDAQHGEFPSRLLDVTYNCIVALYFAVTPYYHNPEDHNDDKDGMVYVFHLKEVASPSAIQTQEYFEKIINKDENIISENMIFNKNHLFIDHCKMNHRIVAQQGAFILFQGDDAEPLPAYTFEGIKIPKKSKPQLRKDLNTLFGIHTGSIYPEIVNLADELTHKSKKINSSKYDVNNELNHIMDQFENELDYYFDKIYNSTDSKRTEIEILTERVIYSYYLGIIQLLDYIHSKNDTATNRLKKYKDDIQLFVNNYNKCLDNFQENLFEINNTSMNVSNLRIILETEENENSK